MTIIQPQDGEPVAQDSVGIQGVSARIAEMVGAFQLTPAAIDAYFEAGRQAGMILPFAEKCRAVSPASCDSLETALNTLRQHAVKNGVSPADLLTMFEVGHAATTILRVLGPEDHGYNAYEDPRTP